MNRLILIGNGFDLAHNLKTSYCDFITDYISNSINYFYQNRASIDPLLEIKYKFAGHTFSRFPITNSKTALEDLDTLRNNDYVSVTVKSSFLSSTLKRIKEINWVDLENDYFDQLISLKETIGFDFFRVKKLNDEFDFFKIKLEEYLTRHEKDSEQAFTTKYSDIFCQYIEGKDIVTKPIGNQPPQKILLLSFNYTSTLEKYKEVCLKSIPTDLNYIHGELGSSTNPIIFGFGDEFNKDYLGFEDLKNKELLRHIKSFGYFKTTNYHNLIRFIDADDFQVYILGHSLGLSDRTMLKQIFEHDRCKSIKIFYHQIDKLNNDYTNKTFDISSHFTDKGMMRKKIVPFNLSYPMPQARASEQYDSWI